MNDQPNIPADIANDLANAARRLIAANGARDFGAEAGAMESIRAALGRIDGPAAKPAPPADDDDLLATLRITGNKGRQSAGGRWVSGGIAGHTFEALVFPEHAECASYELGESRISKLWVREQATKRTVANFERGWDIEPTTETAKRIVDLLAAGLAETVFGK